MICSECIAASICMVGRDGSQCNEFLKRVEALKPSHNSAMDAMRRLNSAWLGSGSPQEFLDVAEVELREFRASQHQ